ncbi:MAG: hypothetical protein JWM44_2649 [Bacilli bacterium]|nr:hypothetical protein [Bacilli bacterium]
MKEKTMNRWSTYDPFFVELADKKVAYIVITHHAHIRRTVRVEIEKTKVEKYL